MNSDAKGEPAVVNILDELLMEKFDDLGESEESAQANDSVRRRSQRGQKTVGSSESEEVSSTNKKGSPRGKRGGLSGGLRTTRASAKNPVVSDTEQLLAKKSNEVESSSEAMDVADDGPPVVDTDQPDSANTIIVKVEPDNVAMQQESEANAESKDKSEEVNASNGNEHDENNTAAVSAPQVKKEDYDSEVSSSDDDGHSQVSNPSLSSASFKSETDVESHHDQVSEKNASLHNSGDEKNHKLQKKEYMNRLNYVLREARFFLMKSNNDENINLSKSKNVWSTPPGNESKINQALKEARNVVLIFSVKESGKFSGFARLVSESSRGGTTVNWILPPGLSQRALGGVFPVDWISKNDLSFNKTQHLFNPWNDGKPVKIGRDGQEIEPHVASELCRLFPMDSTTDWINVLKRSKEAAKNVSHTKVTSPLGSSGTSSRGRSFRERRDTRGRFPNVYRNSRPFDYGRGTRRRYPDEDYGTRPKRSRGSHEFYKSGYGDRGSDMNVNHRYARERPYNSSYSQRRSSSHSQGYPDYMVRDYHHRPPPAAPSPYPPPPPFDNLPPLPRYYDGPPLPEYPASSRSNMRERSASPYEKSVTDFLRRNNRHDRDRDRDRDRERDRDRKYRRQSYSPRPAVSVPTPPNAPNTPKRIVLILKSRQTWKPISRMSRISRIKPTGFFDEIHTWANSREKALLDLANSMNIRIS